MMLLVHMLVLIFRFYTFVVAEAMIIAHRPTEHSQSASLPVLYDETKTDLELNKK